MNVIRLIVTLGSLFITAQALGAPVHGTVQWVPAANEATVAQPFRLAPHAFDFTQEPVETVAKSIEISLVTFPSPVVTPEVNNNTVHCEFFRSKAAGRRPAVVVLHILGGDFDLARLFARVLAHNGVHALFLKMPYYGPRRQDDSPKRMVSADVRQTVAGMRQAVLDIRQAVGWLSSREEVDARRLGIFGISLGGITAALAAGAEPRLDKIGLMLAGGDIGQVAWTSRELAPLRTRWVANGGSREEFFALMKTVDPVTYAETVRGRKILMLNASRDEVIPPACTLSLWRAFGQPEIVWFDAGHYSAMRFIFDGLGRVTRFFQ
jgi:cephalosporin-C deacetylase-like acetyl esterase